MNDFLHRLEQRRLFSGVVDPTFGSSAGATFTPPANATVFDSTVDTAGRPVFVGDVKISGNDEDGTEKDQMFIARLDGAGKVDTSFFGGGINQGTPRGITQLTHVIALSEGGYIGSGKSAGGNVLVRFTAAGRIDSSYGQNGVHKTSLDVEAILERSDHSLIIVGDGFNHPVDSEDDDADAGNYAMHITQKGGVDTLYGGNGNGYTFLGDETWGDDFTEVDNNVNSAANPIDTNSLDDGDIRLIPTASSDAKKVRFLRFIQNNDGSVTAIYRINSNLLSGGTYSITAIADQILDNQQNGNARTVLGELTI